MRDVVSMLHRGFPLNPALFDPIEIGRFRISIQASRSHHCSPQKDIAPYMYDEMELAIYETVKNTTPPIIKRTLHHKWEPCGNFFSYVTTKELQWIYDTLENENCRLENELAKGDRVVYRSKLGGLYDGRIGTVTWIQRPVIPIVRFDGEHFPVPILLPENLHRLSEDGVET